MAFDIDGTLYPGWRLALRVMPFMIRNARLMRAFRAVRQELRREQRTALIPFEDFFFAQATRIAPRVGLSAEEVRAFLDTALYRGWRRHFLHIKPFPHVLSSVLELRRHGLKIALLSDFPPSQKGCLWGVRALCDVTLGTEEIGSLKPSPRAFYALAQRLNLRCEEILYVGNSVHDVEGAHTAGMRIACVRRPFTSLRVRRSADWLFSDYRTLCAYVIA